MITVHVGVVHGVQMLRCVSTAGTALVVWVCIHIVDVAVGAMRPELHRLPA